MQNDVTICDMPALHVDSHSYNDGTLIQNQGAGVKFRTVKAARDIKTRVAAARDLDH